MEAKTAMAGMIMGVEDGSSIVAYGFGKVFGGEVFTVVLE